MAPGSINNAPSMRIVSTRPQKHLTPSRRENVRQEREFSVSKRPQFRASNVMAHALALYNLETAHTVSQTMNMALRQFLPTKYIAWAEQLLTNGRERENLTEDQVMKVDSPTHYEACKP